jgi:hypothetical protein
MSYVPPSIDSTGCHIPLFADIIADLVSDMQSIYGQDIYLAPSSQDYQMLSSFASKINDTNQLLVQVYNSRGPGTAVGSGLDSIIKLNGIARESSTYSICPVICAGITGTPLTNCIAQDTSGYQWSIPATVIGTGGTVTVTATCTTLGPIAANPGAISIMATPTYGWSSVTNPNAVSASQIGQSQESDSALKARQAISTAESNTTLLDQTKAAIASVIGVTRFVVYENFTSSADANGAPSHCIYAVVDGTATPANIAQAICDNKGPGCGTWGTSSFGIIDQYGQTTTIYFFLPTYEAIDVVIPITQLTGYTTQTLANIRTAVYNYLNSIAIGKSLQNSAIWATAMGQCGSITSPLFAVSTVTDALHGGSQGTAVIVMAFNQVTQGNLLYIIITPMVTGVSPVTGSHTGGTAVTLTGAGFTGASAVKFGSASATSVVVVSDTQITCVSPAVSAGTVDVTVINVAGTSPVSSADQFIYT